MDVLDYIKEKSPKTISIDGNSGSGKTTYAKLLAGKINAFVLPFDLFHKRERKDWNLNTDILDFEDFERMLAVIKRIEKGETFTLENVYNHIDGTFTRSFIVEPKDYLIVEGLFSTKLGLDLKIFLNVDPKAALERGRERDMKERNLTEEQWTIKKFLFHDEYSKFVPELKKGADIIIDTTDEFSRL